MFSKHIIILLIILFAIVNVNAQLDSATLRSDYEKEVIYFSGSKYIKNKTKYKIWNLHTEFKPNTEAFHQFQLYKADSKKSGHLILTTVALYVGGLVVGQNNEDVATGLLIASTIPLVLSINFGIKADKKLKKAVWIRNRDVLLHKY
jgi:hypothetical protein